MRKIIISGIIALAAIGGAFAAMPQQRDTARGGSASASSAVPASSAAPAASGTQARAGVRQVGQGTTTMAAPVQGGSANSARAASSGVIATGGAAPSAAPSAGGTQLRTGGRQIAPGTGAAPAQGGSANSARAASSAAIVQGAPKIGMAASNSGVVDEQCKEKYFGCMDSFCMIDNSNGGRCQCSDDVKTFDAILAEIEKLDMQSYKLATEGVDRIDMDRGNRLSEIEKTVDSVTGKLLAEEQQPAAKKRVRQSIDMDSFGKIGAEVQWDASEVEIMEKDPLEGKTGTELHTGVRNICVQQLKGSCNKDMNMLQMMYATQIKSDCNAYDMELKRRRTASAQKLATAQKAMKDAALEKFEEENKYNEGQCITEMRKCVATTGGCGEDFSKCTYFATGEGLGSEKRGLTPVPGSTVKIAKGTLEIIQGKRSICEEGVVKYCVSVKSKIWAGFLVEVAPALKAAELISEGDVRLNILGSLADCFREGCATRWDPSKEEAEYDACLGNPLIMVNTCKTKLEAAGIKVGHDGNPDESNVTWTYVRQKLGAMRVDACTKQVQSCLTNENRCGENYINCIGLNLKNIMDMCPTEALTACVKDGVPKSVSEIRNMIIGIFLNIDNKALEACRANIKTAMETVCGGDDGTCDAFADNKTMGTGSLPVEPFKAANGDWVISGLISFNSVGIKKTTSAEMEASETDTPTPATDASASASRGSSPLNERPPTKYELDIGDYEANILNSATSLSGGNTTTIRAKIKGELHGVNREIDNVVARLVGDDLVKKCIQGQDLRNVRGKNAKNDGRFPELADPYIQTIISAGLHKASENYTKKYNELIKKINQGQSNEIKSGQCAAMVNDPSKGGKLTIEHNSGNAVPENAIEYVIPGAKLANLQKYAGPSRQEYVMTDSKGTMMGKTTMSTVWNADTQECQLTTISQVCKDMEAQYNTTENSSSTSKSSGGIFAINGCGFQLIGGCSNKSSSYSKTETFSGTVCKEMGDPVTQTQSISM